MISVTNRDDRQKIRHIQNKKLCARRSLPEELSRDIPVMHLRKDHMCVNNAIPFTQKNLT
jgi:hypothetical protein